MSSRSSPTSEARLFRSGRSAATLASRGRTRFAAASSVRSRRRSGSRSSAQLDELSRRAADGGGGALVHEPDLIRRAAEELSLRLGRDLASRCACRGGVSGPRVRDGVDRGNERAIRNEKTRAAGREAPDGQARVRRGRGRRRAGRLRGRDPERAARHEDRAGRARASGRHLPELGLHPDQGAPARGRDLCADAPRRRLRLQGQGHRVRLCQGDQALAPGGESAQSRRAPPHEEEQGPGVRRPRPPRRQQDGRGRAGRQGHRERSGPSTSSSRPAPARARCRASSPTASTSGPTRRPWCPRRCRSRSW